MPVFGTYAYPYISDACCEIFDTAAASAEPFALLPPSASGSASGGNSYRLTQLRPADLKAG